jgi:hypothetical protein
LATIRKHEAWGSETMTAKELVEQLTAEMTMLTELLKRLAARLTVLQQEAERLKVSTPSGD